MNIFPAEIVTAKQSCSSGQASTFERDRFILFRTTASALRSMSRSVSDAITRSVSLADFSRITNLQPRRRSSLLVSRTVSPASTRSNASLSLIRIKRRPSGPSSSALFLCFAKGSLACFEHRTLDRDEAGSSKMNAVIPEGAAAVTYSRGLMSPTSSRKPEK